MNTANITTQHDDSSLEAGNSHSIRIPIKIKHNVTPENGDFKDNGDADDSDASGGVQHSQRDQGESDDDGVVSVGRAGDGPDAREGSTGAEAPDGSPVVTNPDAWADGGFVPVPPAPVEGGMEQVEFDLPALDLLNHHGTCHDDVLVGSEYNESFYGGHGDDVLEGNGGSDTFTGGQGADNFVFNDTSIVHGGTDIITDFEIGYDGLTIDEGVFDWAEGQSLSELMFAMDTDDGAALWVQTGPEEADVVNMVIFEGHSAADIQAAIDSEVIMFL